MLNREEIVKKVKEQKSKQSLNKSLKVSWCSLIDKKLKEIRVMSVNPSQEVVAVVRSTPSVEFYRLREGRLVLI